MLFFRYKVIIAFMACLLFPIVVWGQANRDPQDRLEFTFHYMRITRNSLTSQEDFISRSGLFINYDALRKIGNSWDYYYYGGAGINKFEAPSNLSLQKDYFIPYKFGTGLHYRFGRLGTMKWILGLEFGSEIFAELVSTNIFTLTEKNSGRLKTGFAMNLMSMVGANAEVSGTYTYPITPLTINGMEVRYFGVGEGTIKVKGHYRSDWGIAGKVRFEDYEAGPSGVTYFNTRIMLGVFLEID